jgi:hypothetical protein
LNWIKRLELRRNHDHGCMVATTRDVAWDRLNAHCGQAASNLVRRTSTISAVLLPAYAPELNPVEMVRAYLQANPPSNLTFLELTSLAATSRHHGRQLQRRQLLLRSVIRHSPLPLRLLQDVASAWLSCCSLLFADS